MTDRNVAGAIRYLTQQAELLAERAIKCDTEASILSYAARADMCYTLACVLCILYGTREIIPVSSVLGEAEDKARGL